MRTQGKYIVIEGHDGTGKSTQVALLREKLKERGIESVEMHEPAGIPLADRLRDVIKDGTLERDATTNLLLFTAARRELWNQLAKPALNEGKWVLAARNWYSTLAYQGYGEGLNRTLIKRVTREFTDERYVSPDHAVILTLDNPEERQKRISKRGTLETPDTFEAQAADFQRRVEAGYQAISTTLKIPRIDAAQPPDALCATLLKTIPLF